MKKFLQKYLFKPRVFLLTLLILALAIVIGSALTTNYLSGSKHRIEQDLGNLLKYRVSAKNISFLPPNFLIIEDFSIYENDSLQATPPVFIQRLKCKFSLFKLIFKKEFIITQMQLDNPTINYDFIKKNTEEILELLNSLTLQQALKANISKAILNIPQKGKLPQWLILNITFSLDGNGRLRSAGSINIETFPIKDSFSQTSMIPSVIPLTYDLRGSLIKSGCQIEDLELLGPDCRLRLWGKLEKTILSANGSATFAKFPGLNIHDLACGIDFDFPTIGIQDLSFSLNGTPLQLKGSISFLKSTALDLKLCSFAKQPPVTRLVNPRSFDINLNGIWGENKFNGRMKLQFLRQEKQKRLLKKIELILENLGFSTLSEEKARIYAQDITIIYMPQNPSCNIPLKGFSADFYLEKERLKIAKLESFIYDGNLQARGYIDTGAIPLKSSFDIDIQNLSSNRLHGFLEYCSKIFGNLSSQIHYQSWPNQKLSGAVQINNGVLDNMIFFAWVADFLKIPSLSTINFKTLSTEFQIDTTSASLEKIYLKSDDVNLDGYFSLDRNDFVSSRLSLMLSKKLIKSSTKLRRLLNYMPQDHPFLSFNFQLSGLFQTMNFKWNESDFKKVLQRLLPARTERKLERTIEEIVGSISKN